MSDKQSALGKALWAEIYRGADTWALDMYQRLRIEGMSHDDARKIVEEALKPRSFEGGR